jgi:hypothetical protein
LRVFERRYRWRPIFRRLGADRFKQPLGGAREADQFVVVDSFTADDCPLQLLGAECETCRLADQIALTSLTLPPASVS